MLALPYSTDPPTPTLAPRTAQTGTLHQQVRLAKAPPQLSCIPVRIRPRSAPHRLILPNARGKGDFQGLQVPS